MFEDNPELKAEHEALNSMASIIAEKWKGDLVEAECSYTYDGLFMQMDLFQQDFNDFWVLVKAHKHRVAEYLEEKSGLQDF